MTLNDFQQMLETAKKQAISTTEMNVLTKDFVVALTNPFTSAEVQEIEYVSADTGNPRFVMRIRQIYP